MGAPQWQVDAVAAPAAAPLPVDALNDAIAYAIEAEAERFSNHEERAEFTAAVGRIMNAAGRAQAARIAEQIAAVGLTRFVQALKHFDNPDITADAMLIAVKGHKAQGHSMAAIARIHGISAVCLYKRVRRVARFLGIEYRIEKPRRQAKLSDVL